MCQFHACLFANVLRVHLIYQSVIVCSVSVCECCMLFLLAQLCVRAFVCGCAFVCACVWLCCRFIWSFIRLLSCFSWSSLLPFLLPTLHFTLPSSSCCSITCRCRHREAHVCAIDTSLLWSVTWAFSMYFGKTFFCPSLYSTNRIRNELDMQHWLLDRKYSNMTRCGRRDVQSKYGTRVQAPRRLAHCLLFQLISVIQKACCVIISYKYGTLSFWSHPLEVPFLRKSEMDFV